MTRTTNTRSVARLRRFYIDAESAFAYLVLLPFTGIWVWGATALLVQALFHAAYQEAPRFDARITIGPRAISIKEPGRLCLYIQASGQVEAYFDEPRKPVAELNVFALVATLDKLQIQFTL